MDVNRIDDNEFLAQTWASILPYVTQIFSEQELSQANSLNMHSLIVAYCTYVDNTIGVSDNFNTVENQIRGEPLYLKLKEYLTSYCNDLMTKSDHLMNEDLLQFYITEWKKYIFSSKGLNIGWAYINKHWIKINQNMLKIDDPTRALEIFILAVVIWKDTVFQKYDTRVVNTALMLLNRQRRGEPIDMTTIRQLTLSYENMGLYLNDKNRLLDFYKNHFEKQLLQITDEFYIQESTAVLNDKPISEYLKNAQKRLEEEADKVSLYLNLSTKHILVKTIERALVQRHLDHFLVQFQELLNLDKNDDLSVMYSLVNRNPEDLDKFIEVFQHHVHSQGLLFIEKCGEAVKNDSQLYINAILQTYKKYTHVVKTVFQNYLNFKLALEKAFSIFVNRNVVTYEPNTVRKSSELISKYCDILLKSLNSNQSHLDSDQALEDVMAVYKFITDKDVFHEYYNKLLSKRLLNQTYCDEMEFLMVSKLKRDSEVHYTKKIERMLNDVVLSREISKEFAQSNTTKLNIDFNIMILQFGSWPFIKSPQYNLPLELEKCVFQFSKFYSEKHSGKRLIWMHNLSHGEIVTNNFKNRYNIQVSNMEIAILLLFNTSATWSLAQLQEHTNIEMGFIMQIVKILLKVRLVICENEKHLAPHSMVSLNQLYNNKKHRININIPIKADLDHEQGIIDKNIDEDRKFIIQAAIVRIMKARKTLKHHELISEVLQALSSQFQPNIALIKKTIELLIQKEYLERNCKEEVYTYLA